MLVCKKKEQIFAKELWKRCKSSSVVESNDMKIVLCKKDKCIYDEIKKQYGTAKFVET